MVTKVGTQLLDSALLEALGGLSLTQGDILYVNGDEELVPLAKGTAGQLLAMNGGATSPVWVNPGAGQWATIANSTLSSAASFTATGLSAYRAIRMSGFFLPATDNVNLLLRSSTNNGSSYDSGASDYLVQSVLKNGATLTGAQGLATSVSLSGATGVGNASDEGIGFKILIESFNKARNLHAFTDAAFVTAGGSLRSNVNEALRLQATARDALTLVFSSGNIASGEVIVEGLAG